MKLIKIATIAIALLLVLVVALWLPPLKALVVLMLATGWAFMRGVLIRGEFMPEIENLRLLAGELVEASRRELAEAQEKIHNLTHRGGA